MNDLPDSKTEPDETKEKVTSSVTFILWKKNLTQPIVNFVRSKSGTTSPDVLAEEKQKGEDASDQEKIKWNKEFDRLNRSLEFHTDFGLKTVTFFYAALGVVLSIFFGKEGGLRSASIVLLGIPIIMSWILSYYFFYGALIWDEDAIYMRRLAAKLGFEKLTKIELLSELLRVFAVLFFVTGIFLIMLLALMLFPALWLTWQSRGGG